MWDQEICEAINRVGMRIAQLEDEVHLANMIAFVQMQRSYGRNVENETLTSIEKGLGIETYQHGSFG